MTLLSNRQAAALRGAQAANMPHRARLEEPSEGPPLDTGGRVTVWTPYAENVPCRLSPVSGAELPRGLVLTPETNYRLTLPYGQAVAPKDRAVVTGETNGVAWSVTIGFTYVDTPKAFQSATPAYGTDKVEQVGEEL
jgi:hypothetical protein